MTFYPKLSSHRLKQLLWALLPTLSVINLSGAVEKQSDGPRKVIVGTSIFPRHEWDQDYRGIDYRLTLVGAYLDRMAADAQQRYGRGLDIAVLTENVLNPSGDTALKRAVSLEGPVEEYFQNKAREHNTYIVVSFKMLEAQKINGKDVVSNAAVLFDRTGEVTGIYRKVFPLTRFGKSIPEGGVTPGTEFPVFDTDFGRIGLLICYDAGFEDGWEALESQGAELIAWPSASPQTFIPRMYARRFSYYVVTSTPRDNASIIDPLGDIIAQTTQHGGVRTHEIDLNYRILHWQPNLNNGKTLDKAYGDHLGYSYSQREDYGIFWSNDPEKPIDHMLKEQGLETDEDARQRNRQLIKEMMEETTKPLTPKEEPGSIIK